MRLIKRRGLYETGRVVYISPSEIQPGQESASRCGDIDAMRELSVSIAKYGVLQPLTVRRVDNGFELISGERRLYAAKIAGLREVPCIVLDVGEEESAAIVLVENIQRRNLDFIEEARSLGRLRELYGYSQEETARLVGLSQPAVANKLRLLRLPPELLHAVREAGLSERHARALLRLPDERAMADALTRVIAEDMNVAAAEEFIDGLLRGVPETPMENGKLEKGNEGADAPGTVTPAPIQTSKTSKMMVGDYRLYVNTIERGAETMRRSGIRVEVVKEDCGAHMMIHIKIPKKSTAGLRGPASP